MASRAERATLHSTLEATSEDPMTIGLSLLIIAVGAILRFAVTAEVSGVDLPVVGVILMVIGGLGLILGLVLLGRRRTEVVAEPGRTNYYDPNDPRNHPRY